MKSKLQFWTLEILLLLIIIYIGTKISFVFHPIGVFISTLFFPTLISGFLYYLLNPMLKLLMKWKVPKIVGIIILHLALIGLIKIGITKVVPVVTDQVTDIAKQTPETVDHVVAFIEDASKSNWFNYVVEQDFIKFEEIKDRLLEFTTSITSNITSGISAVVSFITSLTLIIITVPLSSSIC